jgi:hypothetical protein
VAHQGQIHRYNDQIVTVVTARPDVTCGDRRAGAVALACRPRERCAWWESRGKSAVPDLVQALRTKDTDVLYESLIAMQKIRDESAGPQITFLLRDLNPKVQIAAIETTGLLRNREAVPDLMEVLKRAKDAKVRRAALGSLAMLPDEKSRPVFQQ